jgi:hypothetical protein
MRLVNLLDKSRRVFWLIWAAAALAFPIIKSLPLGYVPLAIGGALGFWCLRSDRVCQAIDRLETLPPRRFVAGLLTGALVLRLLAIAVFPMEPLADDGQFHRYALSIIRGTGYGSLGHMAFFPPGMSFVLATIYRLTIPAPAAGKIFQAVIGVVLVWQVLLLSRRALCERMARVAAVLTAGFPTLVFYTATLAYETLLALVFVVIARLAMASLSSDASRRWAAVTGLGLLIGFGTLLKPIGLLLPVVLAIAWFIWYVPLTRIIGRIAVIGVLMALTIAPWTYRNYRVLGSFVPVSTNGGYTLYVANNPQADGLATTLPVPLPTDQDGEVARDHGRMSAALSWIASHPFQWSWLALRKITYTWGTTSSIMAVVSTDRLPARVEDLCKACLNVSWAALIVCCGAAIWRDCVWTRAACVPALLLVGYIFLIHLFYEAHSRHHVSVLPFLLMMGAEGLARRRCSRARAHV